MSFMMGLAFVLPSWEISAGEAIYCAQRTMRDNTLGYPLGGSRAVPTTYCRLAQRMGAQVHTRAHVRRIIIEHGQVQGVELRDGNRIDADLVISTSSVRTTALHLCDPGVLPDEYTAGARKITGSQAAVQVKIALNRKLVRTGLLMGAVSDSTDLLQADHDTGAEMYRRHASGRVPDITPIYCPVPTSFDPSLAPPGHQLLTACTVAPTNDIERQVPDRAWEEALMSAMRRLVPGLDDHVMFIDRTTVPWMEHWIGRNTDPPSPPARRPNKSVRSALASPPPSRACTSPDAAPVAGE
ncbi:phytoene dehydrogenase-like protein [Streptomyces aurantiacus]|nr:FAD-dependent oxidoreductase [Streptomyces aurantiacus]MDQ0779060.1 phytoene dehydrogenase-like protein [Streptomyces aurantiacus]